MFRDGSGVVLVLGSVATLGYGVLTLRDHDYLAGTLLLLTGLAVLRAGVELLRSTIGE